MSCRIRYSSPHNLGTVRQAGVAHIVVVSLFSPRFVGRNRSIRVRKSVESRYCVYELGALHDERRLTTIRLRELHEKYASYAAVHVLLIMEHIKVLKSDDLIDTSPRFGMGDATLVIRRAWASAHQFPVEIQIVTRADDEPRTDHWCFAEVFLPYFMNGTFVVRETIFMRVMNDDGILLVFPFL